MNKVAELLFTYQRNRFFHKKVMANTMWIDLHHALRTRMITEMGHMDNKLPWKGTNRLYDASVRNMLGKKGAYLTRSCFHSLASLARCAFKIYHFEDSKLVSSLYSSKPIAEDDDATTMVELLNGPADEDHLDMGIQNHFDTLLEHTFLTAQPTWIDTQEGGKGQAAPERYRPYKPLVKKERQDKRRRKERQRKARRSEDFESVDISDDSDAFRPVASKGTWECSLCETLNAPTNVTCSWCDCKHVPAEKVVWTHQIKMTNDVSDLSSDINPPHMRKSVPVPPEKLEPGKRKNTSRHYMNINIGDKVNRDGKAFVYKTINRFATNDEAQAILTEPREHLISTSKPRSEYGDCAYVVLKSLFPSLCGDKPKVTRGEGDYAYFAMAPAWGSRNGLRRLGGVHYPTLNHDASIKKSGKKRATKTGSVTGKGDCQHCWEHRPDGFKFPFDSRQTFERRFTWLDSGPYVLLEYLGDHRQVMDSTQRERLNPETDKALRIESETKVPVQSRNDVNER